MLVESWILRQELLQTVTNISLHWQLAPWRETITIHYRAVINILSGLGERRADTLVGGLCGEGSKGPEHVVLLYYNKRWKLGLRSRVWWVLFWINDALKQYSFNFSSAMTGPSNYNQMRKLKQKTAKHFLLQAKQPVGSRHMIWALVWHSKFVGKNTVCTSCMQCMHACTVFHTCILHWRSHPLLISLHRMYGFFVIIIPHWTVSNTERKVSSTVIGPISIACCYSVSLSVKDHSHSKGQNL